MELLFPFLVGVGLSVLVFLTLDYICRIWGPKPQRAIGVYVDEDDVTEKLKERVRERVRSELGEKVGESEGGCKKNIPPEYLWAVIAIDSKGKSQGVNVFRSKEDAERMVEESMRDISNGDPGGRFDLWRCAVIEEFGQVFERRMGPPAV